MIVQLTGMLVELSASHAVIEAAGVGYELGISSATSAALSTIDTSVSLYVRLLVRDGIPSLYGFAEREERTLFDTLCAISGVGPKVALSVLSTYSAKDLAALSLAGDTKRMQRIPGVGRKMAGRLVLELQNAFSGSTELSGLVQASEQSITSVPPAVQSVLAQAHSALLSMGFTAEEANLALDGLADVSRVEDALSVALKKLGGGS